MAIRLLSTREAALAHGIKAMVYGKAGIGKTRLCATAPAPVIISAESGLLSLREYDIPVIPINTVDDLVEAHLWLTQSAEARQYATACIDSLSEIGEVVLNNAKKKVNDNRQAYGELIEKMTDTIRAYRDIQGKHVLMTAKMERNKDEQTGMMLFSPSMPGAKLSQQLPYFFDEVFHLDIGTATDQQGKHYTYRFLRTAADYQYDAKDRSGALDAIEKPDFHHIITKILNKVNA